jgi:hypothetical protein
MRDQCGVLRAGLPTLKILRNDITKRFEVVVGARLHTIGSGFHLWKRRTAMRLLLYIIAGPLAIICLLIAGAIVAAQAGFPRLSLAAAVML